MSDNNIIQFNPKNESEEDLYNRIESCLEAFYLKLEHECKYCFQNDLMAKMIFEIIMSDLIIISKKNNLKFTTFDAKLILNKVSERILSLEQEMEIEQETREIREGRIREFKRSESNVEETNSSTEETDREITTKSSDDGKNKE